MTGGYHSGHRGVDYSLGYEPVAAANAGIVEDIVESRSDHPNDGVCRNPGYSGNYVLTRHSSDSNRRTLYLHLQQNGVSVSIGQSVVAGQKIATSGNSGITCGAHLHYGLFINQSWTVGANALNPNGRWTTDPGRVPWRGVYHSESNGGTEYIQRYTTRTHCVKFTNIGWPAVEE